MIPLWIKVFYSLFVAILLPIYFVRYGWRNFLWFSDIALIAGVPALWLESSLIASMMLIGVLIPEIIWNVSYFSGLLFKRPITRLAAYMFDPTISRPMRALSLFHLLLPPLFIWLVWLLGYDERALLAQCLLGWIVLPLTYLLTGPDKNINWVYGPAGKQQTRLHPLVYLGLLMIVFPMLIFLPTHLGVMAIAG